MYQIRLDNAYLLALKADTNLVQSGEKQMLMFKGKSSQSGGGNLKPKMYSKYQPKLALKGCAGGQIVKMVDNLFVFMYAKLVIWLTNVHRKWQMRM